MSVGINLDDGPDLSTTHRWFISPYLPSHDVRRQGRVYLCGLSVYGEPNVRIHGMGAHWCHQEVQIKTTLAVTKP